MSNLARSRSDMGFSDSFEGVDPLSVFLPNLHNFAKTALSNNFE